jgi:hypothetical protein
VPSIQGNQQQPRNSERPRFAGAHAIMAGMECRLGFRPLTVTPSVEVSGLELPTSTCERNKVGSRRTAANIGAVESGNSTWHDCTRITATSRWTRDDRCIATAATESEAA